MYLLVTTIDSYTLRHNYIVNYTVEIRTTNDNISVSIIFVEQLVPNHLNSICVYRSCGQCSPHYYNNSDVYVYTCSKYTSYLKKQNQVKKYLLKIILINLFCSRFSHMRERLPISTVRNIHTL